ncbi:MAG: 16S rRNA (cytosine(1402)-N(4))-methyltransferase RsmH [Bacteroidetes bacterium]|nr:16S rRNA (cytosine(1402)-N(4))-methyltransferase RsmH [Bacteroidota bacterium]
MKARVEASSYHTPVLLNEVLAYLITRTDGVYVDGTLGGGGHAEAVLNRIGPDARLIGIDADEDAILSAGRRLAPFSSRVTLIQSYASELNAILERTGVSSVSGILLDLGVSSHQFDAIERGFSFRADERLDMRMDRRQELSAATVLNTYDEAQLAQILWEYGEEKHSRRLAKLIVQRRLQRPLGTTGDLAALVEQVAGPKHRIKSLARVFQAIRIEVNDELSRLKRVLADGIAVLAPGGRLVVIAYHSLEDRIVKETFRSASASRVRSGHPLLPDTPLTPTLRVLTTKPVEPSETEIESNPRARSAKLRAAERI